MVSFIILYSPWLLLFLFLQESLCNRAHVMRFVFAVISYICCLLYKYFLDLVIWYGMLLVDLYKDETGYGFFTAATYRVPYFAAMKDPNPVNGLLYALGIFLI